jgi:hypothetical protein
MVDCILPSLRPEFIDKIEHVSVWNQPRSPATERMWRYVIIGSNSRVAPSFSFFLSELYPLSASPLHNVIMQRTLRRACFDEECEVPGHPLGRDVRPPLTALPRSRCSRTPDIPENWASYHVLSSEWYFAKNQNDTFKITFRNPD